MKCKAITKVTWGGRQTRSSVEVPVMGNGAKGFGHTVFNLNTTQEMRRTFEEKANPIPISIRRYSLFDKSHMTGDCHVRFCERNGVQFPVPTQLCDLCLGMKSRV
jgi:hypothetical protein